MTAVTKRGCDFDTGMRVGWVCDCGFCSSILRLLSDKKQVGRKKSMGTAQWCVWYVLLKLAGSHDLLIKLHVRHRHADVLYTAEGTDGVQGWRGLWKQREHPGLTKGLLWLCVGSAALMFWQGDFYREEWVSMMLFHYPQVRNRIYTFVWCFVGDLRTTTNNKQIHTNLNSHFKL